MHEIIEKAHRAQASPAELERLAAWRAADPGNEWTYRQVLRLLEATTELRAELVGASPPSAVELLARRTAVVERGGERPRPLSRRAPGPGGWSRGWRRHAPWAVAAAAVLLLLVNVVPSMIGRDVPAGHAADVVTGAGEIVTVQLADGSAVRLAPSSRLRLGENGDPRVVSLAGRAFFSVAQVEGRPFRVLTRGATATVLGTRFEVLTREDDVRLVVVEGRVALEAPENRVEVTAGQVSAVSNRVAAAPTSAGDVDDVLRWTGKFLAFQDTPLREAAREISATYDIRVTIADATLANLTITAVFTGQSLDAVVDVLCIVVNARCVVRADEVIIAPR